LLPADKKEEFLVPAQITVADVSALCVLAAVGSEGAEGAEGVDSAALSRSTVICSTEVCETPVESRSWEQLVGARQDWADTRKIIPSRHNLAILLYTAAASAVATGVGRLLFCTLKALLRVCLPYVSRFIAYAAAKRAI
jgi:hypothetical protein